MFIFIVTEKLWKGTGVLMQTKDKYFNNFNSVCKKENKMFMSVLYHNQRGGFACLCNKTPERFFVRYRHARNYSRFDDFGRNDAKNEWV